MSHLKIAYFLIKFHIWGLQYREKLVRIIFFIFHSNCPSGFQKKSDYYNS